VSPPALEEARKGGEQEWEATVLAAATLVSKAWPFFTFILYPSPPFPFRRSSDIFHSSPLPSQSDQIGAERTEVPPSSLRPSYPTRHPSSDRSLAEQNRRGNSHAHPVFRYICFSEHLTFLLLPALHGVGRIKPLSKKDRSRLASAALHPSLLFTYYCFSFL
jgi:hypothetical protein